MSLFLGKIHYWLFNKVFLLNNRTAKLVNALKIHYPQQIEEFWQYTLENTAPPLPPEKDLADLIDPNNIHAWLAAQINNAQMREAIFINECQENLPSEALMLIKQTFISEAQILAEKLLVTENYSNVSAPELYTLLNDQLLNGMPCDSEDQIEQEGPLYIAWSKSSCSKLELWKSLNVNVALMQELYFNWISTFLKCLNSNAVLLKTQNGLAIKLKE